MVYNRTKERANALIEKGAKWADTPKYVRSTQAIFFAAKFVFGSEIVFDDCSNLDSSVSILLRQVAEQSDVVFTIVGFPKDVREVRKGQTIILWEIFHVETVSDDFRRLFLARPAL